MKDFFPRMRARFIYRADQMLSWHPAVQFIFLLSITFGLVTVAGYCVYRWNGMNLGGQERINSLWEGIWWAFLHIADGGTVGNDHGFVSRAVGFVVTLIGVVIFGLVVAFLASAIQERLEALRRGQSGVMERNHILLLGWSPKATIIAKELALWAKENRHRRKLPFVILAPKPKEAMEAYIKRRLTREELSLLTVVCRTGDPSSPTDLEMVRAHYAKSVIILARTGSNREARVIKILLALRREQSQHEQHHHKISKRRIVIELAYQTDIKLLQSIEEGATDIDLEIFEGHEFVSRLLVQTMRECGLAEVYQELLSFEGNEFYITDLPGHAAGRTFEELLTSFPEACVVGISRRIPNRDKREVVLLPDPMTPLQSDDRLVLIAQHEQATRSFSGPKSVSKKNLAPNNLQPATPEKLFLIGWRKELPAVFAWIDRLFPRGTEVILLTENPDKTACQSLENHRYQHIHVRVVQGDATQLDVLQRAGAASCDQAIILADRSIQKGDPDSRAIISLLHLRHITAQSGKPSRRISEIIDARTKALAQETQANDVILSNELIGMALAQLATEDDRSEVFREILDPKGSCISLYPASRYAPTEKSLDFFSFIQLAHAQRQIAIGIYITDAKQGQRVRLNPSKEESFTLTPSLKLIVLEGNTIFPDEPVASNVPEFVI